MLNPYTLGMSLYWASSVTVQHQRYKWSRHHLFLVCAVVVFLHRLLPPLEKDSNCPQEFFLDGLLTEVSIYAAKLY